MKICVCTICISILFYSMEYKKRAIYTNRTKIYNSIQFNSAKIPNLMIFIASIRLKTCNYGLEMKFLLKLNGIYIYTNEYKSWINMNICQSFLQTKSCNFHELKFLLCFQLYAPLSMFYSHKTSKPKTVYLSKD